MNLVKWNSFIDRPVTSLIDDFFGRDISDFPGDRRSTQPAVNLLETENDYKVEVAVPGMNKENFEVKLDNDVLVISGKKEESKEDKKENYMKREFRYSSFQRSFHLPSGVVDSEKIEANYKDGILHITIPKKEEARKEHQAKQIAIS